MICVTTSRSWSRSSVAKLASVTLTLGNRTSRSLTATDGVALDLDGAELRLLGALWHDTTRQRTPPCAAADPNWRPEAGTGPAVRRRASRRCGAIPRRAAEEWQSPWQAPPAGGWPQPAAPATAVSWRWPGPGAISRANGATSERLRHVAQAGADVLRYPACAVPRPPGGSARSKRPIFLAIERPTPGRCDEGASSGLWVATKCRGRSSAGADALFIRLERLRISTRRRWHRSCSPEEHDSGQAS